MFKRIKWVWIDHFTKFPLKKNFYKVLKKNNVKICIVSPELIKLNQKSKIKVLKNLIKKNNFKIDAVYTKYTELWEDIKK